MKNDDSPIYVTRPFMPPLEEYNKYLEQIWDNKILTNNGPFHKKLEEELCSFLGVPYISLFSNGTLALLTSLQALGIKGEIITTPFSFVATSHTLLWNNLIPVFADIEPGTFTLEPSKIEAAITSETSAILPVHVYGYPCHIEEIKKIADCHGLRIIYDAAHTFGARIHGKSICEFGDLSVLSFHATKVFNTFEGGAIVCHDLKMKEHIDHLKNFGFTGETTVEETGINAKMNEVQAAFGLLQLEYFDKSLIMRKAVHDFYIKELSGIYGLTLPADPVGVEQNYSYFPILIDKNKFGKTRDEIYDILKRHNVYTRRYFYPLITRFPMYKDLPSSDPKNLPVAEDIAQKVLCLPIYSELERENQERITSILRNKR